MFLYYFLNKVLHKNQWWWKTPRLEEPIVGRNAENVLGIQAICSF